MWENGGTSRDLSWKICFVDFMELGNVENSWIDMELFDELYVI